MLGGVDLSEIRLVRDGFDALLERDDLIVAGHDGDCTEFEALGEMHRADGNTPTGGFDVFIEQLAGEAGRAGGRPRPVQLSLGVNEHADLMRNDSVVLSRRQPLACYSVSAYG